MYNDKMEEIQSLFKKISFLQFKRNFKKFYDLGIHPGQQVILEIIKSHPGITNSLLATETEREKATITKTLFRLEKSGLIIRKHSTSDKRISNIYLTEKGEEITKSFSKLKKEEMEFLRNILTDKDIDNILEILNKLFIGLQEKEGGTNEKDI